MLFGSNNKNKKKKKRKSSTKEVSTIISQGTEIEGEIHVKESIRIDGKLTGKLVVEGNILIGKSGKLEADVEGENIEIAGKVEGDVRANGKLKLLKDGELIGDICYSNLVINDGAVFKGTSISDNQKNNNSTKDSSNSKKNKAKNGKSSSKVKKN